MRALLDLLAPPVCVSCGGPAGAGLAVLCVDCRARLPWLGQTCPRCALPRPGGCEGRSCPAARAPWDAAWAPLAHDGSARDLVRALKFRGVLDAAAVMAAHLAAGVPRGLLDGATLVAVPGDPGRTRRRGCDHAALLARALSRRTGAPVSRCLTRAGRPGARQLGAGRQARLAAGGVAMTMRPGVAAPAFVVLVDDVHTTGATFAACAHALRAGATRRVVVVSHTRSLP